jgi:hypothetical protein
VSAIAPRLALCAALWWAPALRAEESSAGIDWQRGVIKAMGKGAPDLNAPSIAVARAAAERAALAAAQRDALRILESATLDDGSRVETLLHDDAALRKRVEGKLRGVRAARTRYFTDGGVWLDIEVHFALLPPRIAEHLRPPSPATGAEPSPGEQRAPAAEDAGTQDVAPDAGAGQGDGGGAPR